MAVGYTVRFAHLPSETPYRAENPGCELFDLEQAGEYLGIKTKSVQSMLNRVQNRLIPDALTDDRQNILFAANTLEVWNQQRVKNIKKSRRYMKSNFSYKQLRADRAAKEERLAS